MDTKLSEVYVALYNDCIHESEYGAISIHETEEGAIKALARHKKKEEKNCAEFGMIIQDWQQWRVKKFKILK